MREPVPIERAREQPIRRLLRIESRALKLPSFSKVLFGRRNQSSHSPPISPPQPRRSRRVYVSRQAARTGCKYVPTACHTHIPVAVLAAGWPRKIPLASGMISFLSCVLSFRFQFFFGHLRRFMLPCLGHPSARREVWRVCRKPQSTKTANISAKDAWNWAVPRAKFWFRFRTQCSGREALIPEHRSWAERIQTHLCWSVCIRFGVVGRGSPKGHSNEGKNWSEIYLIR